MSLTKATYSMIDGAPVNVLDFGAVGDGVTNDAVAIQAALNSGAQTVYIPAGTFKTTATLSIPSNVTLVGAGRGATIIDCQTSSIATTKRIILSSAVNFDGVCPADNYVTYYNSTGDYYVSSPVALAAASTIKPGATAFTVAASATLNDGDWVQLAEGIPAWHPAKSEFFQVDASTGTTITPKTKLRNGYSNTPSSLGAFIRSYALTVSPGGGGAGYPNMSIWVDTGYRIVQPVVNAGIRDLTIQCNQSGLVSKIAWITHLAVNCAIDVEVIDGTFWVVDCQDLDIKVTGGAPALGSSYLANGTNGVVCDIDISNQLALEEGAQNVTGVIKTLGYSTLKQFVSNVNVDWTGTADATPALQISTVRDVVIQPNLKAKGAALQINTPELSVIAPDLPQAFLGGEVAQFYTCGVTSIGGECVSSDNPTLSIETVNGGQIRCIDTVVPVAQSTRYKGTQVVNGNQQIANIATFPAFSDLEVGDSFYSTALGRVNVLASATRTVSSQYSYPGTLNVIIANSFSTTGAQVGDIAIFRLSDSAAAPVNWSWAVVQITKIRTASDAFQYTPANPASRTAITAANENSITFFRLNNSAAANILNTSFSGADAQYGGFISGIGITYGAPLQLGVYQLWVDSSGRLRIKNGVPSSDTDGTVVGTQT